MVSRTELRTVMGKLALILSAFSIPSKRSVKAFVDGAGGGELIRQRLSGDSLRESLIRWSF